MLNKIETSSTQHLAKELTVSRHLAASTLSDAALHNPTPPPRLIGIA